MSWRVLVRGLAAGWWRRLRGGDDAGAWGHEWLPGIGWVDSEELRRWTC